MQKVVQFLLILGLFSACKNSKESIKEVINTVEVGDLIIKEAYFQKEIPGTQNEKVEQYLHLYFEKESLIDIQFERIQIEGNIISLKETNFNLKIDVSNLNIVQKVEGENSFYLFYKKGEHSNQIVVTNVIHKEALYRP